MDHTADQRAEFTTAASGRGLVMAMELSGKKWKLAFDDGTRGRARIATIDAWDFDRLMTEIGRARKAMKLSEETPVTSCYEAGREGFSVHRRLEQLGVKSIIIDAASIETSSRSRRAKTDRLDAEMLARKLIAHLRGEHVFSVVRVPSVEDEAARHEQREIENLKQERTRHRLRIEALLRTEGICARLKASLAEELDSLRTIDGRPLSPVMTRRLADEVERWTLVCTQLARMEKERRERLAAETQAPRDARVVALARLRGVGETSGFRLVLECFGWRKFRNRREVGACFGLTPTPFASGKVDREQGIAKLGNGALRSLVIELSWLWVRYQPQSKLAAWFLERFANAGPRQRRVGIVAVARRLAIDLWKYVEYGVVPEGALMKP